MEAWKADRTAEAQRVYRPFRAAMFLSGDPGAACCALAPGYLITRLRRSSYAPSALLVTRLQRCSWRAFSAAR